MRMDGIKPRAELIEIVSDINRTIGLTGIHLELLSEERLDDFVHFMLAEFYPSDVLSISVGFLPGDELVPELKRLYSDNISLIFVDDGTGDIIAANGILLRHKNETYAKPTIVDEKRLIILEFLKQGMEGANVFHHYGVDVVVNFRLLAVRGDIRQRGLATKLMDVSLAYSKQLGLHTPCVLVEATSNKSQKICEKFEFNKLRMLNYDEFKKNGEVVFKDTGDSKAYVVFAKKL